MKKGLIGTYSGTQFSIIETSEKAVKISDIAHFWQDRQIQQSNDKST